MRQAMEVLSAEHRFMGRVLASLGTYLSRLDPAEPASREVVGDYVAFFRGFAQGRHQRKESDVLFPAIVAAHGGSNDVVAVLVDEQRQGAERLSEIEAIASGRGLLAEDEIGRLAEAVAAYTGLLRAHIMNEDRALFPLVEILLREGNMENLAARLAAYDRPAAGEPDLMALGERLIEQNPPVS